MSDEQTLNRKLLLIVLPCDLGLSIASSAKTRSFVAFPYGPLSIASYVNKHSTGSHQIEILDLNLFPGNEIENVVRDHLERIKPDIVGFSLMFEQSYPFVTSLSKIVMETAENALILVGGATATTSWEEIVRDLDFVDAVCYSEGEKAILELLDAPDLDEALKTAPWVSRDTLEAGSSPTSVYVDSLNDVIDINYDLIDINRYGMKESFSPFAKYRNESNVRQFFTVTSRGCPFKCVFCAEPALHGGNMRYADVDDVVNHVKKLQDNYGLNVLTFYDDQLLLDFKRAKKLFRELAKLNIRLEAPNGVTLAYIDEEMAALMREAGFDSLPLAIEAGTDYMLNKVIKKPLKIDKIKPVVESLQNNGIFVLGYFVLGIPGEREEDRQAARELISWAGIDWASFSLASPVRGSELYTKATENGWIERDLKIGDIRGNDYIMNSNQIECSKADIVDRTYKLNLDVNFVNNRAMRIGDYDTAIRCFQEVVERSKDHAFAHYFQAQALLKSGLPTDHEAVTLNLSEYQRIISTSDEWQKYATHFGL